MKPKVKEYFDKEFLLLTDYEKQYGHKHPILNMRKDKISGAIKFAQYLELLSNSDIQELYTKLYKKEV